MGLTESVRGAVRGSGRSACLAQRRRSLLVVVRVRFMVFGRVEKV